MIENHFINVQDLLIKKQNDSLVSEKYQTNHSEYTNICDD